jgi:hypothetical protein
MVSRVSADEGVEEGDQGRPQFTRLDVEPDSKRGGILAPEPSTSQLPKISPETVAPGGEAPVETQPPES